MFRKIMKVAANSYKKCDSVAGLIAVTIGLIVGLGIGFGIILFISWIFSLIWHEIAWNFNLPEFSLWFWFGIVFVINWLLVCTKKEAE